MDPFNNPFANDQGSNMNIDKFAQQMMMTIKKLKQNKQKPNPSQKHDISDNSILQLPQQIPTNPQQKPPAPILDPQPPSPKNPNNISSRKQSRVKIMPVPRKRLKPNSQYQSNNNNNNNNNNNQDSHSQYVDSVSNRRITDYFGQIRVNTQANAVWNNNTGFNNSMDFNQNQRHRDKQKSKEKQGGNMSQRNQSSNQDFSQTSINNNPVIRSLKEKIAKKKKTIQQLQSAYCKIKQKSQKTEQDIKIKKQNQKSIMIEFLSQKYDQRIYKYGLKQLAKQTQHNDKLKKIANDTTQKMKTLKNQKSTKKSAKQKQLEQSSFLNLNTNFLEIYNQQRQAYLTAWKKKLQSQKSTLDKQLLKTPFWESIEIAEQKHLPVPDYLYDQDNNRAVFEKLYYPLYCRYDDENVKEVRMMNLEKLVIQNFYFIAYPKIMKKQRRIQMKSYIKSVYLKSLQLNDDSPYSILNNYTYFSHLQTPNQQLLILATQVQQQQSSKTTLKNMINRYQYLPEQISRYITKSILRAHERIRKQLNHQAIILQENVVFNERSDVKIEGWVGNEIYRFGEFGEMLGGVAGVGGSREEKYLYFPPEFKVSMFSQYNKEMGTGVWGIGVMLYQMLIGKKPFYYLYQKIDHQEFYVMNDLQFPAKPQISEYAKQLLKACLCKPQQRITFQKMLKHPFFDFKK